MTGNMQMQRGAALQTGFKAMVDTGVLDHA